jgi:hypothetical protein
LGRAAIDLNSFNVHVFGVEKGKGYFKNASHVGETFSPQPVV